MQNKNNEEKFILKGDVSQNVYQKDGKEHATNSKFLNVLLDSNSKKNNKLNIEVGYKINNIPDDIARINQEKLIKKYEIENNQNEIERLKQERRMLTQQQKQLQKMYNDENKQVSGLTNINIPKTNSNNLENKTRNNNALNEGKSINKNNDLEKMQHRADVLYGDDEEYFKKFQNNHKNNVEYIENNSFRKIPEISDYNKMFFYNGTLGEMSLPKNFDLTKYKQDINYSTENKKDKKPEKHDFKNDIAIDYIHNPMIKHKAIKKTGIEAAENLHMSKAEFYMNTEYAREHIIFNNYLELSGELRNFQEYYKEKITKQIGEDKLLTTKGIYIDADTDSSKRLAIALIKHEDFIDLLIKNRNNLKNNMHIDSSMEFKDSNFHNALGKADILDLHLRKNGDIELFVADVYDFNPDETSDLVRTARIRQERGEIIPYFIIYRVIIPSKI